MLFVVKDGYLMYVICCEGWLLNVYVICCEGWLTNVCHLL